MRVHITTHSDDCTSVFLDGVRATRSEYTTKIVRLKIGKAVVTIEPVYEDGWEFSVTVPDDCGVSVEEPDHD